jgi:hypothetical protein
MVMVGSMVTRRRMMRKYMVTVETMVPAGPFTPGMWTIECPAQSAKAAERRVFWSMIAKYRIEPEELRIIETVEVQ